MAAFNCQLLVQQSARKKVLTADHSDDRITTDRNL